jgi:hypothetical protein
MEVNEEIIEQYLKIKKWFYIHDIKFKVYGRKGGSNYSNIDFLAVDKKAKLHDIEIKFRSKYKIFEGSKASKRWVDDLVNQLTRKERLKEIKKYSNKNPIKVIVSTYTCFGKREEKRKRIEKWIRGKLKKHKVIFWYFDEIIEELKKIVLPHGRYDSPILQMIRLLSK